MDNSMNVNVCEETWMEYGNASSSSKAEMQIKQPNV